MLVSSNCWREMPGTSLLAIISIGKLHVLLDQPFWITTVLTRVGVTTLHTLTHITTLCKHYIP